MNIRKRNVVERPKDKRELQRRGTIAMAAGGALMVCAGVVTLIGAAPNCDNRPTGLYGPRDPQPQNTAEQSCPSNVPVEKSGAGAAAFGLLVAAAGLVSYTRRPGSYVRERMHGFEDAYERFETASQQGWHMDLSTITQEFGPAPRHPQGLE